MEVLRFTHPDYEVKIRTKDITRSWERFKGRIEYTRLLNRELSNPLTYCRYQSKDVCELKLYDPVSKAEIPFPEPAKEWNNLWPVIYETCRYQVRLFFYGIDKDSTPEIRHVRKDIEDSFYFDDETTGKSDKSFTGELDFLNEPGTFKLEFSYVKDGKHHDSYFVFDVVSPKLDTKNDYKSLLRDVNEEYENVIFKYLSVTVQQLSKGKLNSDVSWMSAFQSVVDDYLKNIKRIIQNPHSKILDYKTSRKAEHIKRWTPLMEEEYAEKKKEGRLEEHYFLYDESRSTHNSIENQFVKHTLKSLGKRLDSIIKTVLRSNQDNLSESHRKMWEGYRLSIDKLSSHPFFKSISHFDGLRQESLVLQSRHGYRQIYKDWIKLKRGIDLFNGAACIGTLQISEIYELWCFVKMKRLIAEVLGIDKNDPDYESLITEPKGSLLNPFTRSSLEHIVEYHYPSPDENLADEEKEKIIAHKDIKIKLHYQHTFNRSSGSLEDGMGISSATTEQRPDIVLNLVDKNGDVVLTYLYDAKYRVINDKALDKDFEELDVEERDRLKGGDYPPTDSINQMHRYRDAIFYGHEDGTYTSKEVIGGYILFPGRGDDASIADRYFSKSIESVNIGAFPLLPNSDLLLKEHLRKVLLDYTTSIDHLHNAKPQRTLSYISDDEKARLPKDNLVMVARTDSEEKLEWILRNNYYPLPLKYTDKQEPFIAKYILLYINGQKELSVLCNIVSSNKQVWTYDRMIDNNYPEATSDKNYLMIRIKRPEEIDDDLRNLSFNLNQIRKKTKFIWQRPDNYIQLDDLLKCTI